MQLTFLKVLIVWLMGFSQNVSYIFEGFTYPKCKLHLGEVLPCQNGRDSLRSFRHQMAPVANFMYIVACVYIYIIIYIIIYIYNYIYIIIYIYISYRYIASWISDEHSEAYEIELRKKKKLPLVSTCSPLQPLGWLQMATSVWSEHISCHFRNGLMKYM